MSSDGQAKRRSLRKRLKFTAIAVACSLLALISSIVLFTRQSQLVRDTTAQQSSLSVWMQLLQSVQTSLTDADSDVRSYVLTGQARYLAAYRDLDQQLPLILAKLDTVPIVDASIPEQLRDIHRQASLKLGELYAVVGVYDRSGRDAAAKLIGADSEGQFMEQLRGDILSVSTALRNNRKSSTARVAVGSIESQRLTILTVAVLLISIALAGLQIKRLMSAHTRHERALAASERFVHMITDNAPVRLSYLDKQQRFQFANQAVCERLGKSREEIIGRSAAEIGGNLSDDQTAAMLQAAFTGQAQRFEHSDEVNGQSRRIESYLTPDLAPGGEVRGLFSIGVDITHLKEVQRALRDLTDVVDYTPDFVAQSNWRGQVLYINPAAREALGVTATESIGGRLFSDFYSPEVVEQFTREIVPAVKRNGTWVGETTLLLHDGSMVPVSHVVVGHRDAEGRVARYSSLMRDISDEVTSRRDLARQTATLNAVIEAIPAMVAVWDTDLRFRLVNKAYVRWRGRRRRELVGTKVEEVLGETEYAQSLPWAERALAGETVTYEKEFPGAVESRHVSFTYIPLHLKDGKVGGVVAVAQDITHHREENVRLMILSERDPLTGLLNRAGLEKYLSKKTSQGDGSSLAVLYIDLDHFKPINDTHGHATGDKVLRDFATSLQSLVRPTDAVARLGGDEFGVVLSGIREPDDAVRVADKVVEMARLPIAVGDLLLRIGASVGIAFDADADGGWKGLVARADAMVYRAKANGRGQTALARRDEPTQIKSISVS